MTHSSILRSRQRFLPATLLVLFVLLAAPTGALAQKLLFDTSRVSVAQIVSAIESQTVYSVAFDGTGFDTATAVALPSAEPTLTQTLDAMVAGGKYGYKIMKRYIVISPQPAKPQIVLRNAPTTGDPYTRSDMNSLDAAPRRRQLPPPVIEIVDTTGVQPDPEPNGEVPEFTSNKVALGDYLAPGLSQWAVKTNLLYAAGTLTPNLAFEVGVGRRSTIELSGSWNQWHRKGTAESNKKFNHYIVRPEYRYWFCERFTGHFIGGHLFGGQFNISQYEIPLFGFKKEHRNRGYMYGGGITYGYHLPLARRWSAEFHIGVGVAQLEYEQYDCAVCVREYERKSKTYFGPTRAGINLVFMIK